MVTEVPCELCTRPGGSLIWQSENCRVVRVDDAQQPGFCRVIWNHHVREMTDLSPVEQRELMSVVFAVEAAIRQCFSPDKINLASFGNVVPHLHWHVIPRWVDDPHFPEPIWGKVQRDCRVPRMLPDDKQFVGVVAEMIIRHQGA
jgi:diadenosine tetraphosphate (Ap4A) HIT family hydrolase